MKNMKNTKTILFSTLVLLVAPFACDVEDAAEPQITANPERQALFEDVELAMTSLAECQSEATEPCTDEEEAVSLALQELRGEAPDVTNLELREVLIEAAPDCDIPPLRDQADGQGSGIGNPADDFSSAPDTTEGNFFCPLGCGSVNCNGGLCLDVGFMSCTCQPLPPPKPPTDANFWCPLGCPSVNCGPGELCSDVGFMSCTCNPW